MTSSLIQLLKITHHGWSQDLFGNQNEKGSQYGSSSLQQSGMGNVEKGLALLHSVSHLSQQNKREPFVPYLLKNNTGLPLSFAMMTSLPSVAVTVSSYLSSPGNAKGQSLLVTSLDDTSEWKEVPNGGEVAFDFKKSKTAVRQRRVSVAYNRILCVCLVGLGMWPTSIVKNIHNMFQR